MSKKPSIVLLGLLAGAVCVPSSFAAANTLGYAGGINARGDAATHKVASTSAPAVQKAPAVQNKKAAMLKKKKLQQQQQAAQAAKAKKAKDAQALKAQQQAQKKKWYEDDRDRGLDIASEYAPKTIARIRAKNYIARGDTVSTGNGKRGWQQYMDRYYAR